jgi:beta-N-acetylhexosaminidase
VTLEQLAGQLLWCGWGLEPEKDPLRYNDHARRLVEELQVGGLILFPRNLGTPEEIAGLTECVRREAILPPLIGIDQEGGRVCRLPLPGLTFPGNMALGTLDNPVRTREVARAIGEQLAAVGIDVDFAPVVDVNNNPRNPIIGVRSFGEDPERVARHGIAAAAGFREAGILPVLKHFPGHGDTHADSHLELPVQPAGRERLDAVELVPFRAAIRAGAPAVMTTHILFPTLDPEQPSTLSRPILTGLLRGEMGFDGLIVTDCLEMRGITDHWGPEEAAVLALQAGADMLLVCHTWEVQARMHAAICEAVRTGRLVEERLRESARRVQAARELTAPVRQRPGEPARVGAQRYRELEARVAEECLALLPGMEQNSPVRSSPMLGLDAGWSPPAPVLVSGAGQPAERLAEALRAAGFAAEPAPWPEVGLERLRQSPQLAWVALPDRPFPEGRPSREVYGALEAHPKAVVVAMREPYLLACYPGAVPRLAAWAEVDACYHAVARWLAGEVAGIRRHVAWPGSA